MLATLLNLSARLPGDARIRRRPPEIVPGQPSSQSCPLLFPLPFPSPSPARCRPPPPPRLRCAMGGRTAGRARGERSRHLIPSRLGEESEPALGAQGPRRPAIRIGFRDKGLEIAATTPNPGRRQSPRRKYCSGRRGAGGLGWAGPGQGTRGGQESVAGAWCLESMGAGALYPPGEREKPG